MSPRLARQLNLALLAWQFLTRVPPPVAPVWGPRRMAAAPRYFPLVGLIIGAAGAGVYGFGVAIFPPVAAVLLSLAATLLVTGAFHEDGLADTFDGMGGNGRAAALAIMQDSRLGTFGAAALGTTLALKVAALAALEPSATALALIAGHAASRASAVLVIATAGYARVAGGKAGFTAASLDATGTRIALATGAAGLLLLVPLGPGAPLLAGLGLALGHLAARACFERRLGGYTGDCLGATQQLSELGLYLGLLAWL